MDKPIIIIGGGLAGLYAATQLHKRNIAFLLFCLLYTSDAADE